tara:strand:- start:688 stop:1035 length:348 start_codon:yes stop_codon:yes gene_type:complete
MSRLLCLPDELQENIWKQVFNSTIERLKQYNMLFVDYYIVVTEGPVHIYQCGYVEKLDTNTVYINFGKGIFINLLKNTIHRDVLENEDGLIVNDYKKIYNFFCLGVYDDFHYQEL